MELFKILPNGKVEYNFNKFLTIDDVIIAEWEQNDPSLSRESLSKILERIWDKKSYCTNGKGKVKEKYWEQNIDRFIEYRKAKLEHICPYQILEKIDMYSIMNYIIDLIDDGFITKDEFIFQFKDILNKFNLHENI